MLNYAIREAHGNQNPAQIKSELWEREIKIDHDRFKSPKIWWGPFPAGQQQLFSQNPISPVGCCPQLSSEVSDCTAARPRSLACRIGTIICMTDDMVILRKSSHWMILWKSKPTVDLWPFFWSLSHPWLATTFRCTSSLLQPRRFASW